MAAVAVAVTVGVFLLWLVLRLGGKRVTTDVDDIGETLAALLAAAGCVFAARRQVRLRQRLAWALFALSASSWGAGQAVWSWYEIHLGIAVPFPSLADLGYLLACPTAAAAVLLLPSQRLGARRGARLLLDGLIIGIALLAVSWTLVMRAVYNAGGQSATSQAISLAYPISDVVIGTMLLVTLMRTPRGSRSTVVLVAAALATMALADSSFTYYTATNSYDTGNVLDTGWLAGYLLLGLAAFRAYLRPTIASTDLVGPSRLMVLLPYLPVVAAGLIDAYSVGVLHSLDLVMLASTSAVIGLVLIRQMVTLAENSDLLRRVADRESALQHQANHDALTGLPNRVLLEQRALEALAGSGSPCALLFIDLDDFKRVNDSFGHNTGDRVLVAVAERLSGVVRDQDTAARLGGDEFAILLVGVSMRTADDIAERLLAALDQPLVLDGDCVHASATVGIAVSANAEPVAWEELMRRADVAMYAAKSRGKCLSVRYGPELDAPTDRSSAWHSALDRALGGNQYVLHYQPIVATAGGTIRAVEALLRWQHPDKGLLPPASFIRDLEESDAMNEVGAWVLDEACRQCAAWRAQTGRDLGVHVNVSSRQLARAGFPAVVRNALVRHALPGSALVLELTESALLLDSAAAAARLRAIKRLDVEIALDDFGTGFSSLSHLRQLPVDMLKIDKSFIDELSRDLERTSIAEALVRLAESLGKTMVAEGVETEEQASVLRLLGCPLAQGFYYGRAMPAGVITRRLLGDHALIRVVS